MHDLIVDAYYYEKFQTNMDVYALKFTTLEILRPA